VATSVPLVACKAPVREGTERKCAISLEPQWRLCDDLAQETQFRLRGEITQLLAAHPDACLDHEASWLQSKARTGAGAVRIYVLLDPEERLLGYAPFLVHSSRLSFSYAGYTLYGYPVSRYSLTSQPLLNGPYDREEIVMAMLSRVRKDLVGNAVAFGLGVSVDSALGRVIRSAEVRKLFHVMQHGPQYQRRLLRLPQNLDKYMSLLGSKTRQDLRRQERRLLKETGNDVRLGIYGDPESVSSFLDTVQTVSQRTYQWNQLGMGIQNRESTRVHLENVARKGWLRGYVLYARGAPVAYMVGYLYRSTYYSESIGYDPNWAEWSVGNVLHLHVVRDLMERATEWFDFMYGDNSNKERLSSDSRTEGNFYLLPRTYGWTVYVSAHRAFDATTSSMNAVLDHFDIKGRIRRFLRRRAQR